MLEVRRLDIGPATFIIAAALIILAAQIVLLHKARIWGIRLIPIFVLFALTAFSTVMFSVSPGWESVGYVLIATFSACILVLDLLTVAAWWLIRLLKHKNQN